MEPGYRVPDQRAYKNSYSSNTYGYGDAHNRQVTNALDERLSTQRSSSQPRSYTDYSHQRSYSHPRSQSYGYGSPRRRNRCERPPSRNG